MSILLDLGQDELADILKSITATRAINRHGRFEIPRSAFGRRARIVLLACEQDPTEISVVATDAQGNDFDAFLAWSTQTK